MRGRRCKDRSGRRGALRERTAAARGAWGVADQALCSLSNFGLSVVIAHSVGAAGFGAFTLVFAIYAVSLGASQSLVAAPLAIRFSHATLSEWRRGVSLGTGTAALSGVAVGVGCVVVGAVIGGEVGGLLLAVGTLLPLLLVQDSFRFAFFSLGRPQRSFVNDAAWAAAQGVLFGVLLLRGTNSIAPFVWAWAVPGAAAGLLGCIQARVLPKVWPIATWWREQRDLIGGTFGDYVVRSGTARITVFAVAAIAGLSATAAVRGANLVLTPLLVFFQGLAPIRIPEAVRLVHRAPHRLASWSVALSLAFTAVTLAYGIIVWLLLPDVVGRALLGATWAIAQPMLLIATIALATTSANTGAMVGLQGLGATDRLFRARLFVGPFTTLGAVTGAWWAGAFGAFAGQAVTYGVGAFIYWWHLERALAERNMRGLRELWGASRAVREEGKPKEDLPSVARDDGSFGGRRACSARDVVEVGNRPRARTEEETW